MNDAGSLRAAVEIEAVLRQTGVSPDVPTVVYCQAGIRADHTFMVLETLGWTAANYVGSWARWSGENQPVEIP